MKISRLRIEIKNELALNAVSSSVPDVAEVAETSKKLYRKKDENHMEIDDSSKVFESDLNQVGSKINIIYSRNDNNDTQNVEEKSNERMEIIEEIDISSLQELSRSLGLKEDTIPTYRLEAIHLRGTDDLSTDDVFQYFEDYKPLHIEWISDDSCNIVWKDKPMAAKAMISLSKAINGMPISGTCDPFVRSIDNEEDKIFFENGVDINEVKAPIPPGYWRIGYKHPKANCLLMRFAKKSDKKSVGAEKFSDYYKKHGNPNFNNITGYISQSKKSLLRKNQIRQILLDNKHDLDVKKNPIDSSVIKTNVSSNMRRNNPKLEIKKRDRFFRMKMYADEEEDRLRNASTEKRFNSIDLRHRINRLNTRSKKPDVWSRIDRRHFL